MQHSPILLDNISLIFPHKTCFKNIHAQIFAGDRIAIMGRNGSGKSGLMKILLREFSPGDGTVILPENVRFGHVPQIIENNAGASGGERFQQALTHALSQKPNILLLDEPTNHLDKFHRQSLFKLLRHYAGTLVIISHDTELLSSCVNQLWHIDNGRLYVFSGSYDDYLQEFKQKRASLEKSMENLKQEKKLLHQSLMQEQKRAAKSRAKGQKSIDERKWPTVVSKAKIDRASGTAGKKKAKIAEKKQALQQQLAELYLPEMILPNFHLPSSCKKNRTLLAVSHGTAGYPNNLFLLKDLHFSLQSQERLAITGRNGSGKSTLVKAILNYPDIIKSGEWQVISEENIGYLDQHYASVLNNISVMENLQRAATDWTQAEILKHLNDFLFKKPEQIQALGATLSGGEKARLALAQIAAKTPEILILDEITNNLDLETKTHVSQILKNYPGALLIISHDESFLHEIKVENIYCLD